VGDNPVVHSPTEVLAADLPAGATLLDVREQGEWDAGHVDGSVHVPMSEIQGRLADVPDGDLVVVCRSGHRSAQVAAWLAGQGRSAVNLAGGLQRWVEEGRPLVAAGGGPGQVG